METIKINLVMRNQSRWQIVTIEIPEVWWKLFLERLWLENKLAKVPE